MQQAGQHFAVHLRVALALGFLRRARRSSQRGVDNGAGAEAETLGRKVRANALEYLSAKFVSLKQVAKLADRGLVEHRFVHQIDANELAHGHRSYSASSTAGSLSLTQCCRNWMRSMRSKPTGGRPGPPDLG